jgi:hypothetical protein
MKKLNLSKFDLGYIIAFVVVTVLGIGAWFYLSGELQKSQDTVKGAEQDFEQVAVDKKYKIRVTQANVTNLKANIDLIKAQIDPVISSKLLPKENRLRSIEKEDPVAWKHDLDDDVHRLTAQAKSRGITIPPNFYFGFSRYLSQSPGDEQTAVLGKQLVGMDQIVNVLLNAPVSQIDAVRRTYEEEDHRSGGSAQGNEPDRVAGFATAGVNNTYVAYPYEVDFVTQTENLRTVVDSLLQGPYVFIVRSITVKNSAQSSPQTSDLANMAGPAPDPSSTDPNANRGTGPQYLFGNSSLSVKMRIDMIEWIGEPSTSPKK